MKSRAKLFLSLIFILFVSPQAMAKPAHREHKAHVHGAAQLAMAFDGSQGEINYDGAALNIYGFEHPAKSAADKKIQQAALQKLENNIAQIIQFDPAIQCRFTQAKASLEQEAGHSDVQGKFKIACAKSPVGSKVKIDFSKDFPTLNQLTVQIIADSVQKEVKIDKFPTEFEIK